MRISVSIHNSISIYYILKYFHGVTGRNSSCYPAVTIYRYTINKKFAIIYLTVKHFRHRFLTIKGPAYNLLCFRVTSVNGAVYGFLPNGINEAGFIRRKVSQTYKRVGLIYVFSAFFQDICCIIDSACFINLCQRSQYFKVFVYLLHYPAFVFLYLRLHLIIVCITYSL